MQSYRLAILILSFFVNKFCLIIAYDGKLTSEIICRPLKGKLSMSTITSGCRGGGWEKNQRQSFNIQKGKVKELDLNSFSSTTTTRTTTLSSGFESNFNKVKERRRQNRQHCGGSNIRMYITCIIIVSLWISVGTFFYSYVNDWPLPQSFFYAVDAGMSIGFCTEVAEKRIASRAFTVCYIMLGSSCVGGALAIFVQDVIKGAAAASKKEYRSLLEQDIFLKADIDNTGVLSKQQFRNLLNKWISDRNYNALSDEDHQNLFKRFDTKKDGVVRNEEFIAQFHGIEKLICHPSLLCSTNSIIPFIVTTYEWIKIILDEHFIYFAFISWITLGVTWGMINQKWDIITSLHFAVSALATGGLTAPDVDPITKILPAGPAVFCGMYCLLGIPLFALTLGHFARTLINGHVIEVEQKAINKPLNPAEFEFAKSLCTTDNVIHLCDYIVFQLLRQGKISTDVLNLIKAQFEILDTEQLHTLSFDQATKSTAAI